MEISQYDKDDDESHHETRPIGPRSERQNQSFSQSQLNFICSKHRETNRE